MTGYRSGFAAGDPTLIAALQRLRPAVGVTPQEFVQRASVAAWGDERHVEQNRARYAAKRAVFLELFARHGRARRRERGHLLPVGARCPASARRSRGRSTCWIGPTSSWRPGSFFGPEGEGYVRMAMVPTLEECERAAEALDGVLSRRCAA